MRSRASRAAAALLAIAVSVAVGVPAFAADEINIDHIQADEDGTASLLLAVDGLPAGVTADPANVTVTINGEEAEAIAELVEGGRIERTTIVVLDASKSMGGQKITAAAAAIDAFLTAAPEDVAIGLVSFAGKVQQTVEPTTDHDQVATALESTTLAAGTKVYDAAAMAADLAGDEGARSLLVLSDGADTGSAISIDDLVAQATQSGVVVDVVALGQSPAQQATLQGLADGTGGRVIPADPEALGGVLAAQANALATQLLVSFTTPEGVDGDASVDVAVSAGGQTYTDSVFVSLSDPHAALPLVEPDSALIGATGLIAGAAALGLGLAGLLAFALGGTTRSSLAERRMESYFGTAAPSGVRRMENAKAQGTMKDSAVDLASTLVKGDFEDRLALRLAGAGSLLKPAEWLLLHAGLALGGALVGLLVNGPPLMLLLLFMGAVLPWLWLRRKHGKRQAAFSAQLAETLTLMAGGLSAGLSLPQAVDTVVREGQEPMAGELRRALVEQRLGVPVEDALEGVGDRMESQDFRWVVMAVRIQREVGGNLAELLTTVSETLREREYLRRQVRVLSAEGRFSGYVLAALPPIMFAYMLLVRPDFVRPLYTTGTGLAMICAAIVLLAMGMFVMSKLVKVEV